MLQKVSVRYSAHVHVPLLHKLVHIPCHLYLYISYLPSPTIYAIVDYFV